MKTLFESNGDGGSDGFHGGGFYNLFFSRGSLVACTGCFEIAVQIAVFVLLLFGVAVMLQ